MPSPPTFSLATLALLGSQILNCWSIESIKFRRQFRSQFGVPPRITHDIWMKIRPQLESNVQPLHLLIACHFLASYTPENSACTLFNVSEKTYHKWAWYFITTLANTHIVRSLYIFFISNSFQFDPAERFNSTSFLNCFSTVDGTDCPVREPRPFFSKVVRP